MQVPVAVGVTLYEGIGLYRGNKVIASKGDTDTHVTVSQLMVYATCGIVAGLVGGLLGLGGGFIMGPMFLELGVPPQVSSATATFAMTFSSSMSVVEYYLLKRFPVPYGRRAARTTQQEYVKLQEWKNQERTHRHQQQSPESWHTHRHSAVARTGRRAQHNTAYSQTQHRNTDTNSRARKLDWSFSLAGTLRQGAQCSV